MICSSPIRVILGRRAALSSPAALRIGAALIALSWSVPAICQVKSSPEQREDAGARDENGNTPLHRAAGDGSQRIVELLLAQGADVNARNKDGQTPLDLAADMSSYVVTFEMSGPGLNDPDVETARRRIENPKSYALGKLLIAHGADVNAPPDGEGRTPLLVASAASNEDLAELLVQKGARVKVKEPDGTTPLHYAAFSGEHRLAGTLIANGAPVSARGFRGTTPLHLAAMRGDEDMVKLLVANGADVNARDDNGYTPVHAAAGTGSTDALRALLANNGEPGSFDFKWLSVVGLCGGSLLFLALPVMALRWRAKFGAVQTDDPEFASAKRSVMVVLWGWGALAALLIVIVPALLLT
jgi:ankyrin repeat protein